VLDPVELFPEVPNLYEFPSVHADMVFDERRVESYQKAINATVKKGDVVVDVGAGTGLLTFLSLQAGAARVHAIERSPVIKWAEKLAEKNGFSDRIVFHNSDARDVDIDEKADVIVSELIGHLAFEEGMAETISDTKEKFLAKNGRVIPSVVTLFAAPVSEKEIYSAYIDCWETVWGIDFSVMREQAVKSCYIVDLSENDLMSERQRVCSIDFRIDNSLQMEFDRTFSVFRSGEINGIALWFNAELVENVRLSSDPWTKTHWKQCFVPLPRPLKITQHEHINLKFDMHFRTRANDKFVFSMDAEKVS
tara:strand:+ start:21 stop:941 length:921 start_codon:yes stop_codon:yes gene_type:complete